MREGEDASGKTDSNYNGEDKKKQKKYQQIRIEVRGFDISGFEGLQNKYEVRKTETLEGSVSRCTDVGTSVFFERCQEKLEFLFSYYLQSQLQTEIKSHASQHLFSLQ